jgi:putative ABC transport system permease protein
MSALGRVVRAGVGRRRVQTAVMTLTILIAVAASVLATGLLVASKAPFDHAFAKQHGAHLTGQFDRAKVTAVQLAATARVHGVAAAAGPFPIASLRLRAGANAGPLANIDLPLMTVAGRADAGGPVDDVSLVKGSWATGPGQIVMTSDHLGPGIKVGTRFSMPDLPGSPTLTLVGLATSVGQSADAWVTPAQLASLTTPDTAPAYQMLYRFTAAGTEAQVSAGRAAIVAAVPSGALSGSRSYLSVKLGADGTTGAFVPFVTAFAVLGLLMSVLIIGIVVSGAVGAGTRRIGILKSLGFTPAQVVRAYVGQALIPAAIGTGLGVVCGNLLAIPMMGEVAGAYGTGALLIPAWVDAAVPAAALALVVATALVPALRAGRLRTAEVISVGRTPRAGGGRRARHLLGRLPLPRSLSLGLANPFAHPSRSATMAAAVAFGAIAVTFAVGLNASLVAIQTDRNRDSAGAVVVDTGMPGAGPGQLHPKGGQSTPAADPAAVAAAIHAQPATRAYYGTARTQVSVPGINGATQIVAYQGDVSWAGYRMISGTWFNGPGQAVAPTRFLQAAGVHVGDTITLTDHGRDARVRIVGEVFDLRDQGMDVLTDISSLAGLAPEVKVSQYNVEVRAGTDLPHYLDSLNSVLSPIGATALSGRGGTSGVIAIMEALIATLTLMLAAVAGLGVLNTVVLDTRERVHDVGVFKALGMTPRQTVAMVITSVAGIGLVAGVIGVPIGIALHDYITPVMGHAVGTNLPTADIAVYHAPELVLLALGGLAIAAAGALLPAGWAARTSTATALRTE